MMVMLYFVLFLFFWFQISNTIMINWQHYLFEFLALLHFLLILAVIAHILIKQKNYGVAIAWIATLVLMPFLGAVLYLIFGHVYVSQKYNRRYQIIRQFIVSFAANMRISLGSDDSLYQLNHKWQALALMSEEQTGFGVQRNHTATLLANADAVFDALLRDIRAAQKSVMLEFYIVHPQGKTLEVLDELIVAKRRGVSCVLLADSVGSAAFFRSEIYQRLLAEDISITPLLPVGLFKTLVARADIRNHRKLVCIDEMIGYTGSFNLVDPRFFKQDSGVGQWIDVMIRTTHRQNIGVVKAIGAVIASDLASEQEDGLSTLTAAIQKYTRQLPTPKKGLTNKQQHIHHQDNISYPSVDNVAMQLLPSAPRLSGTLVYNTIVTALYNARRQVVITTPYFVPDESLMLALINAVQRGVTVTLILPQKSDSMAVKYASQAYFLPLLQSGVTIALYQDGLLHSKIVWIDNEYAMFGTVNMDMRSFYINMEVTLAIYRIDDKISILDEINDLQTQYLSACRIVTLDEWQVRKWYQSALDGAVRLISPLL